MNKWDLEVPSKIPLGLESCEPKSLSSVTTLDRRHAECDLCIKVIVLKHCSRGLLDFANDLA